MAASSSSISGFHFRAPTYKDQNTDDTETQQVDEVQEHGGPPEKAKENRKKSKLMIALSGKKDGGLTKSQEARLRKHAKDHSQEHMEFMRVELEAGKTFKQAHKTAMERYGR